eukprot:TRINITY_DN848_c0_g1_i2.p1 TRINITY_DN848_c0_g1~~TRINITY_DN848_c0_g1_i2.p1  ORF type:complete len:494 (-),score=157.12 TRINITY_DN848_c0_g1_i2:397-1878(-)
MTKLKFVFVTMMMIAIVGAASSKYQAELEELKEAGFQIEFDHHGFATVSKGDLSFLIHDEEHSSNLRVDQLPEREISAKKFGENPFDWVPEFKAAATPSKEVGFQGNCFNNINVQVDVTQQGAEMHFNVSDATHTICDTLYLIATDESYHLKRFVFKGEHHLIVNKWKSADELKYVQENGFQIFMFREHLLGFVLSAFDLIELFKETKNQPDLIQFLEKKMDMPFVPRKQKEVDLKDTDMVDGDYLAIMKLNGTHGGDNTVEAYGTGGYTGHVALVMHMDDGELYVVESINPYISKTPWQEWVKTANEWNWLVGVLRLKPEHQATFKQNIGKAQQFVNSMIGHPYGFHNYLFGWIDTPEANFPSPITQQTLATVFQLVDIVKPAIAVRMWGEALNKRLGTHGLNVAQLFDAMNQRNLTFGQVISMPENDTWVYSDGLSRVCSTFVMSLYKETGVIGPDIQATEFTPRDSVSVREKGRVEGEREGRGINGSEVK